MNRPVPKDRIKSLECKHAIYSKANDFSGDDILFIKENIHTTDGQIIPNTLIVENYQRDFYVTKEGYRTYKDKIEWEDIDKLQKFSTNQARLIKQIPRALGNPALKGSLKMLGRSPYLFGTDITTPTLVKHKYKKKYPDTFSINTVAVIDIETDVVNGTELPIIVGVSYKDKAFISFTKDYVGNIPNFEEKILKKAKELLPEEFEKRNIKLETVIVDTAAKACVVAIQKVHEWRPDFLTVWNMNFDIPKITKTIEDGGYDPADVYSDPSVPKKYRNFKYKAGQAQKVTASGDITPIPFDERWHVAEAPASFVIIDSMCLYRRIRIAKSREASYSLDAQLNKHLGKRKLRFEEAEGLEKLEWHIFMQNNFKVEYGVYNLFDCIGVELLDEKLMDLQQSISVLCGDSEYSIFNSQPKRIVDQLYFFCLENLNKVVGACSDKMSVELDKYVLGMKNWIITLPTHLTVDNGLKVIKELPDVISLIRAHVADLDVSSAYPTTQKILNMSKETTYREVCKLKGIDDATQRNISVDLTASHVNAVYIVTKVFNAPTLDKLLEDFEKEVS